MSKKYLVTGGAGFIGSAIIKKLLLKKSNKVVCLDSNIRGNLRKLGNSLKKTLCMSLSDMISHRKLPLEPQMRRSTMP